VKTFVDQTGRSISIPDNPQRIVSLVPSQTELLADLGLNDSVVGITKFCVHPENWFRTKTRIGGTKNINIERIKSLQPDLIIANKEENEKEQVEELAEHFPVWTSDISSLSLAKEMILAVGEMTGRLQQSQEINKKTDSEFDQLKLFLKDSLPVTAAYLIWNNPLMSAGGDTFISIIMSCGGFKNIFEDLNRYPEITEAMIKDRKPEVILLSSEPFPFKEKHLEEFRKIFGDSKLFLVDGEMFSWYGSRLQHTPAYLRTLFEQIQSVS
jgi:ABC-type Fe3+-hydroxamate transport system substrate-binding protein